MSDPPELSAQPSNAVVDLGQVGQVSGRRAWRVPALALTCVLVGGVVWGLAWWQIAPTAATQVIDGAVYLTGHDDLQAGQDSWFAIIGAVVAAVLSAIWPVLTRRTPVAGVVSGLVGSTAAGLLAWRIGSALGPDSLKAQLHAGIKAPITPLVLHTPIAVLIAPLFFAAVRIVIEILGHFTDGRAIGAVGSGPAMGSSAAPAPAPYAPPGSVAQGVHIEQGQ